MRLRSQWRWPLNILISWGSCKTSCWPRIVDCWNNLHWGCDKGKKLLSCNCYRPPIAGVEFWDVLQCQLDKAKRGNIRNIILVSDLNADPSMLPGHFLKSFVHQNHMHIHVDKPTRITLNSSTCLDQIISNIPFLLKHVSIIQPISGSDHNTVTPKRNSAMREKYGTITRQILIILDPN